MGNCAGQWPDNLLVSNTIIEDIKKLEPDKLFYYFDQWSELKSLKHTSQFLYKIQNRYKQIQNKSSQGIKEILETSSRNKFDYKQAMYFHTNQMIMLVKACTEQKQMVRNFHKDIKDQMQKKKGFLKSYGEKINEMKQKSKKIKSQIINNSIDVSLSRKVEQQRKQIQKKKMQIQKQVSCFEQKIKKSFAADPSQMNQQEKEGIISTQIQNIKVLYEGEIQLLNTQIFDLKDNIKRIKKQSNEALSFLNAEKQQKLKKAQQLTNMKNIEIQNLRFKIGQLNSKIDQLNSKINQLLPQSTNIQQSQEKARHRSSQIFNQFINSKVIYRQYHKGKKNKEKILQIFKPLNILKSKLIFAYDKVKPNNMFQYIDNQQNLVFLGQMQNGTIIGGFSKQGFKQDMHKMNKNLCFIFSIHPGQQYNKLELKGEGMAMHSVKLDKNYLRFGSNEIRVTCGSNKGYSVINSSASIFSPKQSNIICNLEQFLGQKQQKYELLNYQVFQLQISDIQIPIKQQKQILFSAIDHQ